jgi:ParB-like chromosome segregation protein Spo0J
LQGVTLPVDAIRVGERHRKDLGDIAGLAASMAGLDMLEPIVVRPAGRGRYELVCGARRLAAAKQRGQTTVPAIVRNLTDAEALKAEFAENTQRKDFTLSEAVAIKRALEPIEREAAKQRQRESKGRGKKGGQVAPPLKGRAADKAAKATGVARRTLEKAEAIVDAAKAEPEKFGKLREDMDRTGRANGPFKRLKVMQQAERIRAEPPPLPGRGPYRGGMIDIAWAYEPDDDDIDTSQRGVLDYPTLSIEQACALDVGSIMHQDAVLGFWVINFILLRGLHIPVLSAWGFESKALVTWPKDHAGRGHWAKGQTEHLVIATRGNPTWTLTNQTTLLQGPFHLVRKGKHSSKPVEAYTFFESLCPAPRYCDLFSRYQHNDKWDCHGDEAPSATDAPDDIPGFLRRVKGDAS